MTEQTLPKFAAISSRTMIADHIVEHLRGGLREGRFEAGHVFAISELTEAFEVSRTPVREALSRLVAEGVLEDDARGQVKVPPIRLDEFRQLTYARCVVEGGAAAEAAQLCPKADLPQLQALARLHYEAFDSGDIPGMLEANAAFHFSIYERSGNPFLIATAKRLWLRAGPYTRLSSHIMEERIALRGLDLYSPHHFQLLDAIEAGDAERARQEMVADIETGLHLLLPHLQNA